MDYIDVPLQASPALAWLLAAVHAAAIIVVIALPVPWWVRLAGCALLLANCLILISCRALLRSPGSIVRMRLMRDGSCRLHTRDHGIIDGWLRPARAVSPLMIVLRVACPGKRLPHSITLLPDTADAETLRQLRIFLRFALGSLTGQQ